MQNVEFVRTGYGKNMVKVLFIRRQGSRHSIIELRADVEITLNSRKDYLTGDNSDIIPTDTVKNTVHALAKIKGVTTKFHVSSQQDWTNFTSFYFKMIYFVLRLCF